MVEQLCDAACVHIHSQSLSAGVDQRGEHIGHQKPQLAERSGKGLGERAVDKAERLARELFVERPVKDVEHFGSNQKITPEQPVLDHSRRGDEHHHRGVAPRADKFDSMNPRRVPGRSSGQRHGTRQLAYKLARGLDYALGRIARAVEAAFDEMLHPLVKRLCLHQIVHIVPVAVLGGDSAR